MKKVNRGNKMIDMDILGGILIIIGICAYALMSILIIITLIDSFNYKRKKRKAQKTDVLDKIRAEIEQKAKDYDKFNDYRNERGLLIALAIIDKYNAESEEKHESV